MFMTPYLPTALNKNVEGKTSKLISRDNRTSYLTIVPFFVSDNLVRLANEPASSTLVCEKSHRLEPQATIRRSSRQGFTIKSASTLKGPKGEIILLDSMIHLRMWRARSQLGSSTNTDASWPSGNLRPFLDVHVRSDNLLYP